VTTTVDDAALDLLVPNLVLQPLVENAIKHGVSQVEGGGRVEVEASVMGDELVLRVRDDGPGVAGAGAAEVAGGAEREGGVGLRNTRERLAQLYGARQRFTLRSAPGGGAVAELAIPARRAPAIPATMGTEGDA